MAVATPPRTSWRQELAPYARPSRARGALDLATSVLPYAVLIVLMWKTAANVPFWATGLIAIPTAAFLLRTYIVFHDCTHGSFLPGRRVNEVLGTALGLLVYTPFAPWKHAHLVHHGSSGDLDRRGVGDVPMLTVAEYQAKDWKGRLGYRLFRNPLVMFGLGPIWAMLILPRLVSKDQRARLRRAVILTDVALVAVIAPIVWAIGWQTFLAIQGPMVILAGGAGIFLFYVQHQYEDAYWESGEGWSYEDAALRGSSYFKLPKALQFFSGNIGLHHVHHLSAKVPNYNLQRAHDACTVFASVPVLRLRDGLKAVRLKLWDEDGGRFVTWAQLRQTAG